MTITFFNGHTGQTANIDWGPWVRNLLWLSDGKFLGLADQLYRFNPDDSIDNSFRVVISPMPQALLLDAELMADGKVLVTGHYAPDSANYGNQSLFAYRINPNGSLDSSFGNGKGWVGADFSPGTDILVGSTIQADGKILMVGQTVAETPGPWGDDSRLFMTRLTTDGRVDTAFGAKGYISIGIPYCAPRDMVVQADGKIIVSCAVRNGTGIAELKLLRFNIDGSLDLSFGANGIASGLTPADATNLYMGELALQPDGKIVVLCNAYIGKQDGATTGFEVVRFNTNGQIDTGFGQGGHIVESLAPPSSTGYFNSDPFALLTQDDGRIIVGIQSGPYDDSQLALLALRNDGSIDTNWGKNGAYFANFGHVHAHGDGIFVRHDGTIFVKGITTVPGASQSTQNSFSVNADGSVDKDFGATDNASQNSIVYKSGHTPEFLNDFLALSGSGTTGNRAATLTIARHGGANANDQFSASAEVGGVLIGDLEIAQGSLRMIFKAGATANQINEFLHSIRYSNSSDITSQQDIAIDWMYSDGAQRANFTTSVNLTPSELPAWIDELLGHTAAGQTDAQLRQLLNAYVGSDKILDVSYITDAGGTNIPSADLAGLRSLMTHIASTIDLRIGADKAIDSDLLAFHSAPELAPGNTAFSGPSSLGTNIFYKPGADGITSMMGEIQSRLAQVLGLQNKAGLLDPFGPLETAALQYLYGPSRAVRTGDDNYKLDADSANFLWDGVGKDTIDGSALLRDLTLHLEAGHWDYIGAKGSSITSAGQITVNYGSIIENALGGSGNDHLFGTKAANILRGGAGNDTLAGQGGSDVLDGGTGVDTATYSGKRADYAVIRSGSTATVSGASGKDVLTSVERLHFADADIAIDIDGNAGQLYRLYQAIFNRQPDLAGLGWWLDAVDRGVSLESVAESFTQSREFATMYGANASNTVLLTKIYEFALHRMPDKEGFAWWLDILDNHKASLGSVLMGFSESQENYAQVIGSIQHGIAYTPFHD